MKSSWNTFLPQICKTSPPVRLQPSKMWVRGKGDTTRFEPVTIQEYTSIFPTRFPSSPCIKLSFLGLKMLLDRTHIVMIWVSEQIDQSLRYDQTHFTIALNTRQTKSLQTIVVVERNTQSQNGTFIHTRVLNSLSSRFFAEDYFDWYWATNIRASARYEIAGIRMILTGSYSVIDSVQTNVQKPWSLKKRFQGNPSIRPRGRQSLEFRIADRKQLVSFLHQPSQKSWSPNWICTFTWKYYRPSGNVSCRSSPTHIHAPPGVCRVIIPNYGRIRNLASS